MSKTRQPNKETDAPRGGRARSAGDIVGKVGGVAFKRFGFIQGAVVSRWTEIVGERYAKVSSPESIRFPAGRKSAGVLTLLVEGAHAPLVQHLTPLIIERVNRFFGYQAVDRLVFRQGRPAAPPEPVKRPELRPVPKELGEGLRQIADPELRACLESLAARLDSSTGPPSPDSLDDQPFQSSLGANHAMKGSHTLLAAVAMLASGACNAEKGNDAGATAPAAQAQAVKPPANGDWSQVVTATPAGGFMMGNPNASVKLVEFGSMTCPHCREFDEAGMQPLVDKYVKTGRVAFEFRNYIRDPFDLAGALIARCNGAKGFFPLTRAMFKDQPKWMAKLQTVAPEQQQALAALGPDRQFVEIAKLAGFQQWAAQRGLPSAKSNACLRNEAEVNRLVQMTSDVNSEFPQFPGTPSFTLNGELLENAGTWPLLEPKLREALGG